MATYATLACPIGFLSPTITIASLERKGGHQLTYQKCLPKVQYKEWILLKPNEIPAEMREADQRRRRARIVGRGKGGSRSDTVHALPIRKSAVIRVVDRT